MKKLSLLNIKKARKMISANAGRKPNLHWKILFVFGIVMFLTALAGGVFVFWFSENDFSKEIPTSNKSQTFSKKQFDKVIDYFAERAVKYEAVKTMEIPEDPS